MIKLDYFRYFKAVAEAGSFARAAESLFVSTTSVVHAVNQLEEHYKVQLLIRRKSIGVILTQDGEKLLAQSNILMLEVDAISESFLSGQGGLSGQLVVGCQEGLTWSLLPRVIDKMARLHPKLDIVTKTVWMSDKYSPLENGEVDVLVTFSYQQIVPPHINSVLLCQPDPVAMMRKGHPLYQEGEKVWLKDLVTYPQIMINDADGFSLFYGMYSNLGLEPKKMLMSNISTGAQAMVGRGDAISLRILKPAHDLSPLGDKLVFPALYDVVDKPDLVVQTNKTSTNISRTKHSVIVSLLKEVFDSGEMRAHINY